MQWPRLASTGWRSPARTGLVLSAGRSGTGGTTIIGVDGWVAAESRAPGLVAADVQLEPALDKRLTDHADAFGDRRPELYTAITRTEAETNA